MSAWRRPSIDWLFVLVPMAVAFEHAELAPPLLFGVAALAILPIARLIVRSTEQLATYTGDAVGGLLNATFGNAPELIIALVALRAGYLDMVRASLIGAILANLLLALGVSFLLGGLRFHDQRFNPEAARTYGTLMLLAAMCLIVPSTYSQFFGSGRAPHEEQLLNVGIAIVLLVAYALYLLFSLKTHPRVFDSVSGEAEAHAGHAGDARWTAPRAAGSLIGASLLAALLSEVLVGAAEGTGRALGMSETFVGIVLLAVVGGAAESGSAIAMARKDKLDLSLGILLGSSIQIALFVAPLLVLISFVLAPEPMFLSFRRAEVGSLFLGVLLGVVVAGDGRANWYKGVQLITVYAIVALMFYTIPEL